MSELLKVHVGCGPRLLPGWVNVDIDFGDVDLSAQDPGAKFLRTDVTASMPFHDATVDAVYSEDFFEHLDQRGQFYFLAECLRVMKPVAMSPQMLPLPSKSSSPMTAMAGLVVPPRLPIFRHLAACKP